MSCYRCWGIGCYFCPGSGHDTYRKAKERVSANTEVGVTDLLKTAENLNLSDSVREKAFSDAIETAKSEELKRNLGRMKGHFYHTNK